ncbi:MAG TPA: alpha-L-fucosidase [Pirellulales bacterium]|jgi:alpha-L-fucosidase|nr:alpha-L-fucosidase [Pirellulales bacterium]
MIQNRALILCLLGMCLLPLDQARAQMQMQAENLPATEQARRRDEAAAAEALKGWWTAALKTRDDRLNWWRDAKFGCFIHWGVYADLAGEYNGRKSGSYSEHIMRQLTIPRQEYLDEVVSKFNPEKFDANAWVQLIKNAGMRYIVITAKHHDGFAMYPSQVTKYNITDATSFKRDPMQELSQACRANGLRFGFYYSHAFDWEDPNAPGNDWDYKNPGGDKHLFDERLGAGYRTWYDVHPELVERIKKYVDDKAIPQLQELIAKYHPDILWFDVSGKLPFSEQIRIVKAVREADPNVVINGRAARGLGKNFGDYADTADNPAEVRETEGDWEAIPTVNNSYGYNKLDNNYKTPEFFIQLVAKIAAKGGNTLLNIGPKGDGTIDENATRILEGIGRWMSVNGDSIHGTTRTSLDRQAWGDSTVKSNILYLHVFQWPSDSKLVVGNLDGEVVRAYLLADADKHLLAARRLNNKDIEVTVPNVAPDATDSVVVLEMNGPVHGSQGRLLATNVTQNQLLAFDATASGKFSYGDGKANRYAVTGFNNPDDYLAWPIRLNAPATFDVSVRCALRNSATLVVQAGEQTASAPGNANDSKKNPVIHLGQISLPTGEYELRFKPEQAAEVSLFEVFLKPKQ